MKRTTIYLTDPQSRDLREYARERGVSMSRAIRELVPTVEETIRRYHPDGEHTKDVRDARAIERILAGLPS